MNYSDKKLKCIHKYLTKSYIEKKMTPGLGDFLRGTVSLFKLSEIYNYDVFIDKKSHIFFSFFEDDENYINDGSINDVIDYSELKIDAIDYGKLNPDLLEDIFKKQKDFSIVTNTFYTKNENGEYVNFGKIPENIQNKLKKLLIPTKIVKDKLEDIFKNIYKLKDNEKFKTIHVRLGDNYLVNNKKNHNYYDLLKHISENILTVINNDKNYFNYKYIFITDTIELAVDIVKIIPEILYWNNKKTHMGYSDNQNEENILDTIIDFIILSKSQEIIGNNSGFSRSVSEIYNIKYNHIFDIEYFN
uniref:GDP-fucose protein O-fucosyltransferase n=1 Tax=viral metagenome TaxID=1070528 RepID=A0A6C0HT47_9ZZZZ